MNKQDMKTHYSCKELAELRLPGKPTTRQGWDSIVNAEQWPFIEVSSRGRMGKTREYEPPPEVLKLIAARTAPLEHAVTEDLAVYSAAAEPDDVDMASIDYYPEVKGSAGPGALNHDGEVVIRVKMDAKLLRERVGHNFGHLKLAGVSGDSMYSTLAHGDQVLIDTSVTRFIDDAIYAIVQDGFLRYKRIQKRLDGSIVVKSDNPTAGEPEIYKAEEAAHFHVVGIVLPFKFGRFKI